jgi:hypothetical protein
MNVAVGATQRHSALSCGTSVLRRAAKSGMEMEQTMRPCSCGEGDEVVDGLIRD